jgi:hypothetical protein
MLFNLGFKRCNYCNKLFYPQHNRQVHCKPEHRKKYFIDNQVQKRFKERQIRRKDYIEYYDNHGKWTVVRSDQLELGSMRTGLEEHRHKSFSKEKELVENQLKALGLKGVS